MPEPIDATQDVADDEEAPEQPAKKKGPGLPALLLLLILLPAVGGGILAYLQYPALAENAASFGLTLGLENGPAKPAPVEYGQFATLNDLVINPAGTDGNRFLLISLGLETKSADVVKEVADKDIVIRDAVLRVLSKYTDRELASVERRAELKDELLKQLNAILQKGSIERLYFTQYLLQ